MNTQVAHSLTKKLLMTLPEGCYIVSNVTDGKGCPVYDGEVTGAEFRDLQWEKIKQVRADQRACHVFGSKAEFVRFFEQVEGIPINRWAVDAE